MKSLDSREVTNDITGFIYLRCSDKIRRIGRILEIHILKKFDFKTKMKKLLLNLYNYKNRKLIKLFSYFQRFVKFFIRTSDNNGLFELCLCQEIHLYLI